MARSGSSMSCPFRAGVGGDVEMEEAPPLVHQHHEDIENSKGDGRHHEEVRRDQLLRVDIQECPPGLRRRLSPTNHVLGHGGLGDFNTELEQFPMDPRRSPEPIGQTHLADQLPNLPIDRRPSRFALPTLPSPIATDPLRCQEITVSGFTISSAERHCDQRRESPTQSSRSANFRRTRPRCDLFRTVSRWRRARISTCRAVRDRNHDRMLKITERRRVNMGGED